MSAPAFTPWTASIEKRPAPAPGHWYVVLDEDENGIGEFYGDDHDANVAHLRLAAAAPELYEALAETCRLSDEMRDEYGWTRVPKAQAMIDRIQALLAKARGEA